MTNTKQSHMKQGKVRLNTHMMESKLNLIPPKGKEKQN